MAEIRYGVGPRIYKKGVYKSYTYYITENYSNPCAYVLVPRKLGKKKHPFYRLGIDRLPPLPVHGGITYFSKDFMFDEISKDYFVLGWDYCHGGDYVYFDDSLVLDSRLFKDYNKGKHKWKYKEIMRDVTDLIELLLEVEKYEKY